MQKTISMSLQGVSYPIEEAAYDRLDRYLTRIRRSFPDAVEAEEVAGDIEARMAERLSERIDPGATVTLEQAEWLIAAIGDPAGIDDESPPMTDEQPLNERGRGKLLRSPDNKMIAGVCGGLGVYFSVDVVWVRMAFVVGVALGLTVAGPLSGFAYFSLMAIIAYAGLWLLLPIAPASAAVGVPSTGSTAGTRLADSLVRQAGSHESLKAVPAAVLRGGREGAAMGRGAASRIAGAAREPLSSMPAVARGGRQAAVVGWDVSSRVVGTAWHTVASVLGVSLLVASLVGMAIVSVAGISLVANDVPSFIGFYAEHVAPFRADNEVTFVAVSVAGFLLAGAALLSTLALGASLALRR